MDKFEKYIKLKSGTDIRGNAVETETNGGVQLTDEAVADFASGFALWLKKNKFDCNKIAVGHDSRISAKRIKQAVVDSLLKFGINVYDCGLSTTPSMFMIIADGVVDASIQITASHHPYDKNGLKFFINSGGLDHEELEDVIKIAASDYEIPQNSKGQCKSFDYMSIYAKKLRQMIIDGVGSGGDLHPLKGISICVDAGNGVGGFYANDVLAPLGADVTSSQFLQPDGMFPNHAPNPENKDAMLSLSRKVVSSKADFGIIFDTDVDRAGCVSADGKEINRNRLIAVASTIALQNNPGATIVTDSVTSFALAKFISSLGGVHYRYKRGYKNVINKQIELNNSGINCPLAIETSGHGAFRENYYLDDGAYLITKIIIKMAQLKKNDLTIDSLYSNLAEPVEEIEFRPSIKCEDFKQYGQIVIDNLIQYAAQNPNWQLADDNREGVRVYFGTSWFMLRLSVHDPILPFNAESYSSGNLKPEIEKVYNFLKKFEYLDLTQFEKYLEV